MWISLHTRNEDYILDLIPWNRLQRFEVFRTDDKNGFKSAHLPVSLSLGNVISISPPCKKQNLLLLPLSVGWFCDLLRARMR